MKWFDHLRCYKGYRECGTHNWWWGSLVGLGSSALPHGRSVCLFEFKMRKPFDLAIQLLGVYPKDAGMCMQTYMYKGIFLIDLLILTKYWKKFKCSSVGRWLSTYVVGLSCDGIWNTLHH